MSTPLSPFYLGGGQPPSQAPSAIIECHVTHRANRELRLQDFALSCSAPSLWLVAQFAVIARIDLGKRLGGDTNLKNLVPSQCQKRKQSQFEHIIYCQQFNLLSPTLAGYLNANYFQLKLTCDQAWRSLFFDALSESGRMIAGLICSSVSSPNVLSYIFALLEQQEKIMFELSM